MSHLAFDALSTSDHFTFFIFLQTEIVKRMSAIIGQVLPFLSQEHQQQVATAVERAKQVTMSDLNSVVGVSICNSYQSLLLNDKITKQMQVKKFY